MDSCGVHGRPLETVLVERRRHLLIIFFLLASHRVAAQPLTQVAPDKPTTASKQRVSDYLAAQDESILQRHRPFYFAYGEPLSKLQVSFKVPLIQKLPLYFAYTQSMFWKLREESKPFEDFTFNPEIFYRLGWGDRGMNSLDFGIFGHNSNGKKGDDSRSLNMSYMRLNYAFEGRHWMTRLGADLSSIYDTDEGNRNIYDYIGPLSLHISFVQLFESTYFDKSEIDLDAIPGGKYASDWTRGGYQLTWSFRLGHLKVIPAFYLQYYTGYGETLLNYDKFTNAIRAGLIF